MIIVISDVHLGYTKSNRESFREFLDRCMPLDIEHFVILGDLMDFWRANNARAIIDDQDILGLIGRLNARNVYYIPGNHDYYVHKLAERYKDFYPFRVSKRSGSLTEDRRSTSRMAMSWRSCQTSSL